MAPRRSFQLVNLGFILDYVALVGALVCFDSPYLGGYRDCIMGFVFLPMAIAGSCMIAIEKLSYRIAKHDGK
jgi:hypothetical protein